MGGGRADTEADRHWGDVAWSQKMPGAPRRSKRQGTDSLLEPSEGAQLCQHLGFAPVASRTGRANACCATLPGRAGLSPRRQETRRAFQAVHFSIARARAGACPTVKRNRVNRKARWERQASHMNGLPFPPPESPWYNVGERNTLRGVRVVSRKSSAIRRAEL